MGFKLPKSYLIFKGFRGHISVSMRGVLSYLICCFVMLSVLAGSRASAVIAYSITGTSGAPGTNGDNYYFSNITDTTYTPTGSTTVYYTGNPTAGGACNTALNPTCLTSGNTFQLIVSSSTATTSSAATMYLIYSNGQPTGTIVSPINNPQVYAAGQQLVFNIPFSQVCSAYAQANPSGGLDQNCLDTAVAAGGIPDARIVPMYIVANAEGDGQINTTDDIQPITMTFISSTPVNSVTGSAGIYDFTAYPGDQELFVQNLQADYSYPVSENSVGAQYVRIYYTGSASQTYDASNFTNLGPLLSGANSFFDAPVNGGNTNLQALQGLTDGVRYYIRVALRDYAGNIGFLTDPTTDAPGHSTIPDQIAGLINQNGHCFIATAAFGSNMEPQVKILREFRDKVLLKTQNGRDFVSWYYRHSPKYAEIIKNHAELRAATRASLYPLVAFSYVALQIGGKNASLLFATLLMFPLLAIIWLKSIKRMRELNHEELP